MSLPDKPNTEYFPPVLSLQKPGLISGENSADALLARIHKERE